MESKAAVLRDPLDSTDFTGTDRITIETVDVDGPDDGEVLIEIATASLCGTDVSIALGKLEESYPMVMGHEGAGIVKAVGNGVDAVSPGDHVVLGRSACGRCEFCRLGKSHLCECRGTVRRKGTLRNGNVKFSRDGRRVHHCHGVSSFSEYTVVSEEVPIPITDELPLRQASLLGCGVFTGAGAVMNSADIEPGSSVAIFGAGGVGLSAVQGARLRSAGDVIAVDLVPEKLELARELGATHTVNAAEDEPVEAIKSITDGGVDYAFEVIGRPAVVGEAVDALRPRGTAVIVGTAPEGKHDIPIDTQRLVTREQSIRGAFNGSYNLSLAIPKLAEMAASGRLQLDPLITDCRPLDELTDAMAALDGGRQIRQLIRP